MGEHVVSYGGGTNSVALLILLKRLGVVPRAIVMADPGSERKHTVDYRDRVLPPWLHAAGFPQVTVINRWVEGVGRPRTWRLETLFNECWRTNSLPSVAYGWRKCSDKYKGQPQRWWIDRQAWARESWERGRKLIKVIGYDFGEDRRARRVVSSKWEDDRFVPSYPLIEARIDRDGCEELILSEGLPLPGKSACGFCPNNKLAEWIDLRRTDPAGFDAAVALSRHAEITSPDVVGLMRCNPHGQRQLHVWAVGGYGKVHGGRVEDEDMPCDCSL